MKYVAIAYLALVVVMSMITFCVYGFDKFQARRDGRRTPEKLLHRLSMWGGWPGAWLGQKYFRHKTQKREFQLVYWLIVFVHLALIGGAIYLSIVQWMGSD